jgi:hypothetical protein
MNMEAEWGGYSAQAVTFDWHLKMTRGAPVLRWAPQRIGEDKALVEYLVWCIKLMMMLLLFTQLKDATEPHEALHGTVGSKRATHSAHSPRSHTVGSTAQHFSLKT